MPAWLHCVTAACIGLPGADATGSKLPDVWLKLQLHCMQTCVLRHLRPEHQALSQELAAAERELDLPGQEAQLQAAQAELAAAETELAALDKAAEQLSLQESQYWHEFNNFQACLATHVDDRDGMLTKVSTFSCSGNATNILI